MPRSGLIVLCRPLNNMYVTTTSETRSSAAMRVVGKQAVAVFVRGGRQSSGSGNRGVLPVYHGERKRRLPMVSGGT
jgi:hypothetical protein